jgi:hypothetical protein
VTGRNLTDSERQYLSKRSELLEVTSSHYVADAPHLFMTRVQTTTMLSRISLFDLVRDKPGAIIECGVYRGSSLMLLVQLSLLLEPYAINRHFYGFDTFAGFRSISETHDPSDINESMFSQTDEALLRAIVDLNDLVRPVSRIPKVELVKGDVTKTVPEFVGNHPELCISLLILDTDLYESTKIALTHFLPHMHKGAIVVLDEVCYQKFLGETIAMKEVMSLRDVKLRKFPFDAACGYFEV